MAIDFRSMDKRKVMVLMAACGAALIAMVLTNTHINNRVDKEVQMRGAGIGDKEVKKLMQRIDALEKENKNIQAAQQQAAQQAAQVQNKQTPQKPQQPSLALTTPSGHRAITVKVDSLSAVGGMISPGDFVDIIAHLSVPSDLRDTKKTEIVTVTLFQNVKVLAMESNLTPGTASYETQQKAANLNVTFALDPQEANLLTFAQRNGKIQLVLRTPLDSQAYALPPATWESVSAYILEKQGVDIGAAVAKEEPAGPSVPQIEIYRSGGK